ncbi:MAG: hypothetical protein MZV63_14800 [Marinilabiliales bacterium]|nr:hypothetical protein [Marinilabiliales bacterium]
MIKDHDTAEEIVQDLFFRTLAGQGKIKNRKFFERLSLQGSSQPLPSLYRIIPGLLKSMPERCHYREPEIAENSVEILQLQVSLQAKNRRDT